MKYLAMDLVELSERDLQHIIGGSTPTYCACGRVITCTDPRPTGLGGSSGGRPTSLGGSSGGRPTSLGGSSGGRPTDASACNCRGSSQQNDSLTGL
jgi:hypothetical protein